MAISIVNTTYGNGGNTSPSTAQITVSPTAGNQLIVTVNDGGRQYATIADSFSGTWVQKLSIGSYSDGGSAQVFTQASAHGGSTTITVTAYPNDPIALTYYEVSGLDSSLALDLNFGTSGTSSPITTGLSGSTANTNELLFGIAASNDLTNSGDSSGNWSNELIETDPNGNCLITTATQITTSIGSGFVYSSINAGNAVTYMHMISFSAPSSSLSLNVNDTISITDSPSLIIPIAPLTIDSANYTSGFYKQGVRIIG